MHLLTVDEVDSYYCIRSVPRGIFITMVLQEQQLVNASFHDCTLALGFILVKSVFLKRF